MKLALLCLCLLHVAFGAGLFHRDASGSRTQTPQRAGSVDQSRQRPLFARREQYERQRIHTQKPKEVPVPPKKHPPPKVAHKPVKPNCSELTQSCLPQAGCCDLRASCHCRFFNAICFCRRTSSLRGKKT